MLIASAIVTQAQVPQLINYQGRVAVGTPPVNFDGSGHFKFALVNANGSTTYWSNDGTSTAGSAPTAAVMLPVVKGLYNVLLGDTALTNMTAVPTSVFTNSDVRLRVWFNDGTNGFQLLTPDQRIAAVGYAIVAGSAQTVADGAITSAKIATGAITSSQLANGAVGSAKLASNLTLSGTTTGTFTGSGTTAFQTVAGTSQTAASNANYLLTNAAQTVVTLPGAPVVGDVVRINGVGAGGWQASPNSGQSIVGTSVTTVAAGATWTALPNSPVSASKIACSADGNKLITTDSNRLYTSTDSGATWTPRENTRSWTGVASSSDGTKLAATVQNGQIYTSTDSGATWTARDSNRSWQSIASSADGSKLVATVYLGQIYTSTNSGASWTARESNRAWQSVASSADGTKLLAASIGQLYTSTDSGVTWTARDSSRYWFFVASSADGTKLLAEDSSSGTGGGRLYTSTDSGVTWTPRESNRVWSGVASSADGTRLLAIDSAGGAGGLLYTSVDSGVTWTPRDSVRSWYGAASSSDGVKFFATWSNGPIYTSHGTSTSNPLAGTSGTTAALQYIGNNQWQVLTEATANSVAAANITGLIANTQLASPSVTINTGSGLTGGGTVALGGSLTLQAAGGSSVTSLTGGGGISVSGATGAVTLGSTATSSNTANAIVSRDASGGFSAGTMTTSGNFTLPVTTSATVGVLRQNGVPVLHTYNGLYLGGPGGTQAGNFTNTAGGGGNMGLGSGSLASLTTGIGQTAVGTSCMSSTTSGTANTAVGSSAFTGNTTGGFNVVVGEQALRNSNGSWNIAIGRAAGSNLTTGSNNIVVGNDGVAGESNTIRIGNPGPTGGGAHSRIFLAGIRGVTTGASGAINVLIDGNGQLGTVSSSRRYKEDIIDMGDTSARIAALRPVTFRYKTPHDNGEKPIQFGLIAEEVAEVFPELAVYNEEGQPETVKYQDLTPMLLNEVQKLRTEKEALAEKLAESDARLSRLESLILQPKKETEP
jgi:hypothetical protein